MHRGQQGWQSVAWDGVVGSEEGVDRAHRFWFCGPSEGAVAFHGWEDEWSFLLRYPTSTEQWLEQFGRSFPPEIDETQGSVFDNTGAVDEVYRFRGASKEKGPQIYTRTNANGPDELKPLNVAIASSTMD